MRKTHILLIGMFFSFKHERNGSNYVEYDAILFHHLKRKQTKRQPWDVMLLVG